MNKKNLILFSTIVALFLAACGSSSVEESSSTPSSSATTSETSSITTSVSSSSSSESSVSSESSSSEEPVETWGLVNGDFEDETDDFTFQSTGWNAFIGSLDPDQIEATASYKTEGDNQYGALTTTAIGDATQWWHAQLRQNGIFLYQNGAYILSFKVRAATARTIRVTLKDGGLSSRPINEVPVEVSTAWETKTINFIAPSDGVNSELQFGIGPDSYLPNDLKDIPGYARSYAEVHLDDVMIELGEPLPNQAPTISGGDLLGKAGEAVLIKGGLTVRDDYDKNIALADVTALDLTNGAKLDATSPSAGIYSFLYTVTDSEGLLGTHLRQIIITDENQLLINANLTQFGPNGMPLGWAKWYEDNNGGLGVSTGVRPHLLPEALLGNIQNGDFAKSESFESGRGWSTFISTGDGMNATVARTDEAAVFTTTSIAAGTEFWHGQLIHGGNIRLPKGNFKLEFKAKAAEARTIRVALEGDGIAGDVRAINELPVLLSTNWETYTIDFSTVKHVNASTLRFFFGPDSFLPTEPVDLTAYARNTATVYLDDVTFRYEDAESPVATLVPTMAVDLWRIVDEGMPWENQVKYERFPFYAGTYRLQFSAYSEIARPLLMAMEGNGGVADPNVYKAFELDTTAQRFSHDVTFLAASSGTNTKNLQFFMGSYRTFGTGLDGLGWGIPEDSINASDNIETTIYLFDFSFVKVA